MVARASRRCGAPRAAGLAGGIVLLLSLLSLLTGSTLASPARRVLATTVQTEITPVIAGEVADALERAGRQGYAAYVLELDTPGGLSDSMRDIVKNILASPIPVLVYVSPQGARAASAGAVITLAAQVAVMAPGTSIGAATPVGLQGEDLATKIVNDAAAQAESLARLRGRNVRQAEAMVREGRSFPVDEAVRLHVVDARAPTLEAALRVADGRRVRVANERLVTVRTAGAHVDRADPGFFGRVRQFLANPNLTYLLLTLGILGLLYELAAPGGGLAGGIGAVALVLALFSMAALPVNAVGVLLIVVAAGLFAAELFVPGTGALAAGGGVALVLAGIFLFDDAQGVRVEPIVVIPAAIVMVALAVLAGRVAVRSRRGKAVSGTGAYRDRTVTVHKRGDGPEQAFMDGTWWTVRSTGPPLHDADLVRIVDVDGLTLVVEPVEKQ